MLNATEKYLRKVGKVKRIKIISARRTSYGFPIPLIIKRIWADCEQMCFHHMLVTKVLGGSSLRKALLRVLSFRDSSSGVFCSGG